MTQVNVLLLTLLTSGIALADNSRDEAKKHFRLGDDAYKRGEYEEAVREYEATAKYFPNNPGLHYDLAQAHRKLGHLSAAVHYYRLYLETVKPGTPAARYFDEAQAQVQVLTPHLEEQQRRQSAPPEGVVGPDAAHASDVGISFPPEAPPQPTPQPTTGISTPRPPRIAPTDVGDTSPRAYKNAIGWSLVATGLATSLIGPGLLVHAQDLDAQVSQSGSLLQLRRLEHDRDAFRDAGIAVIAVGSTVLVAGVIVFAIKAAHHRPRRSAFISGRGNGGML